MDKVWQVFRQFLILGCYSFGGPAAHIGYFRQTFVEQLRWLSDKDYGRFVALSQFLPGPGSSQVGFAVGYHRAGLAGACAAFLGFTLPSFILLYAFAILGNHVNSTEWFSGLIHGLKLLAVVVVSHAVWSMGKNFCFNKVTFFIAAATAMVLIFFPSLVLQIFLLTLAGAFGFYFLKNTEREKHANEHGIQSLSIAGLRPTLLVVFGLLLALAFFCTYQKNILGVFSSFYISGSLVFGGGHVVLPLLQDTVGEALTTKEFISGYAAAQAIPGPMFSLSAYLGATMLPEHSLAGALTACMAIFLPGFLLLLAVFRCWENLLSRPSFSGMAIGLNACVVGLLSAALYSPVIVGSIFSLEDIVAVLIGLVALIRFRIPILSLVIVMVGMGLLMSFL